MIRNKQISLGLGIFASLCWGLSFIWYKTAYTGFGPLSVVVLRLTITTILLGIVAVASGSRINIARKDWKYFLLLALFEPFAYFLGESFGMKYVSSTLGALIIATIPLFTPIPAYILYREKVQPLGFLGLALSISGVGLVVWQGGFDVVSYWGIPLMFVAVLSAVCYGLVLKRLSHVYNSITIVRVQSAFGIILFLPLFLLFEAKHFQVHAPVNAWLAVFALGIFASCVAYLCISIAIRNLGVNKTNLLANLIPVFTAVIAYVFLHESFGLPKIAGGIMVLTGVLLFEFGWFKRRPSKQ
ncbi:MAG TPA: DMT family transporter [Candidatus Cloacimonadota bacterium]|nr:DMT family transporter [Candidatus Cloacimonadota bacterium]HPT71674.1 DMT family transporter [Candidatus Cloacimonadota bacterium]